jgi:hypothetical protein
MAVLDRTSHRYPFRPRRISARNFFSGFFLILIGCALFGPVAPFPSHGQISAEYKLKAAFLYNFVQFVDWPQSAFPTEESPLVIGVLGADPFGNALDEIVEGEIVKNRKLVVRRYKAVKEIDNCHILFVSRSVAKPKSVLDELRGRSILTVGDLEGFTTEAGGMVRFITERNKIRFRINLEAAKAEKLTISSKLLQLSEIVSAEKRP